MRSRQALTYAAVALAGLAAGLLLRTPAPGPASPPQRRGPSETEQKLSVVLPEVRFVQTPFEEAIQNLRDQSGANIVIETRALKYAGLDLRAPVDLRLRNVTLEQAISILTRSMAVNKDVLFTHTIFDDQIVITSGDELNRYEYFQMYDVRDIRPLTLGEPATMTRAELDDELVRMITTMVEPESWSDAGGSGGMIRSLEGRLIVLTISSQHRKIQHLLDQLRSPATPQSK